MNIKKIILTGMMISCLFTIARAETSQLEDTLFLDKTRIVSQQIDILQHRLLQAQNELNKLQQQDHPQISIDNVNKQLLSQAALDIAVAKSNRDSISIELSESQQTMNRIEKDAQEIDNQINVYSIFGMKIARSGVPNMSNLETELRYQKKLLQLEKIRADYLSQLQETANSSVQAYKTKYTRLEVLLKSQTMMRLKEQQAKSELNFQREQSYWLKRQNALYNELNNLESHKPIDKKAYSKLENDIFYANENVNFTYLQMLVARYQDQMQQLKVSISHGGSITLLNKVMEQMQLLGKQLIRVNDLLKNRLDILAQRKAFFIHNQSQSTTENLASLANLHDQYTSALENVAHLNKQLFVFRGVLDQALQQELASRQGLPSFGSKAWFDLGAELLMVPNLTFHVLKSLTLNIAKAVHTISYGAWILFFILEAIWVGIVYVIGLVLERIVKGMPDHEYGHVNLKWLLIKVCHRNLVDIVMIANLIGLFLFCRIPLQNFNFLMHLAAVWMFFKSIITIARLCLVETVHDRAGHDVRLYHRLKWTFIVGGVITALTGFIHQLPLIYTVKDLFDRFFLLFLSMVSIFLLKSWEVLPSLILPHVDNRHTYIRGVVRMLCVLIPFILLCNSIIGLFGFVNFVQTISWYEGVFLMVMLGYLFVRGLFGDAMQYFSQVLIRHVSNGWLWTEAFLKPLDKVIRVVLFLMAWGVLFAFYGWDHQSPVVIAINKILHYQIVDMLNTSITLFSILELGVIVSVLYWAARWTREFVYRLLLSRTKDLGVRNSIAILSQYTTILIGVFICLRVLGIDFHALTVVAGALAFGVGLGLRDLVNNFACGFLLLLERPLRVGDTVTINGYEGEVIHIGGRAVTIKTWDHMEVLVPNAEIFSKTFLNWTARDHIIRTVISIKINRHDKPQDVQAVIYQVLAAHKDVLRDPPAEVFMKELNDGMTEFEVRYFINLRLVKSRIAIRSEVLVSIWEIFEKHGIKPPYPHHEIFLKNGEMTSLLSATGEA